MSFLSFIFKHVSVQGIGVWVLEYRSPQRPEESAGFPGDGVLVPMSCMMWVLETKLGSSVETIHVFNF